MKKILFVLCIGMALVGCEPKSAVEILIDEIVSEMGDNPKLDSCYGDCEYGFGGKLYHDFHFTYSSGDKYVGEWKHGKYNGQGTFTFGPGNYVGEFKDGKFNGQGTYTIYGHKYVGEHKDGKKDGHGTFTWDNGNKYVGEWKDSKMTVQGTMTYSNGNKYVGEWSGTDRSGMRHGQGTYTCADGSIWHSGLWRDRKRVSPSGLIISGDHHPNEIPNNGIDDDNNGYIDDVFSEASDDGLESH